MRRLAWSLLLVAGVAAAQDLATVKARVAVRYPFLDESAPATLDLKAVEAVEDRQRVYENQGFDEAQAYQRAVADVAPSFQALRKQAPAASVNHNREYLDYLEAQQRAAVPPSEEKPARARKVADDEDSSGETAEQREKDYAVGGPQRDGGPSKGITGPSREMQDWRDSN